MSTEKLNLKRPFRGGANPLHQDFPYWEKFADDASRVATAMLFLDDSSLENGTLEVIPGSHTTGKWKTRTDSDVFGNLDYLEVMNHTRVLDDLKNSPYTEEDDKALEDLGI